MSLRIGDFRDEETIRWPPSMTSALTRQHNNGPWEVVVWADHDGPVVSTAVMDSSKVYFHVSFLIAPPRPWEVEWAPPSKEPVEGEEVDVTGTIVRQPLWKGGRIWRLTGEIFTVEETQTDYYVGQWPD